MMGHAMPAARRLEIRRRRVAEMGLLMVGFLAAWAFVAGTAVQATT